MVTGGLVLEDLPDEARNERGLAKQSMALAVKYVGEYGTHAAGKKAGFRKDDLIVQCDGKSARISEGELLGYLLQHHQPGERVKATVLRKNEPFELSLPIQ